MYHFETHLLYMNINQALDIFSFANLPNKEEIKKKYKQLAKQYHPDISGGSSVNFIKIKQAYDLLINYKNLNKKNKINNNNAQYSTKKTKYEHNEKIIDFKQSFCFYMYIIFFFCYFLNIKLIRNNKITIIDFKNKKYVLSKINTFNVYNKILINENEYVFKIKKTGTFKLKDDLIFIFF